MSSSKSSPTNTTSTSTSLQTINRNVSGNTGNTATEGSTISNSNSGNTITTTSDFGAIQAGTGLASQALATAQATTGSALADVLQSNTQSLDFASNLTGQFTKSLSSFAAQDQQQFGNLIAQDQTQLGNVVSALSQSFASNNTSASAQAIQGTTDLVKYVGFAAVALLAIYMIFRS